MTNDDIEFVDRSCQRKKRYFSEVDALIKAEIYRIDHGEPGKLRAYQCHHCGGWHLTKSPPMYVDPPVRYHVKQYGKEMACCHLFTDGDIGFLHRFALSLGLRTEWFQAESYPHYDLIGVQMRELAIKRGAVAVDRKEAVRIWRETAARESMPRKHEET